MADIAPQFGHDASCAAGSTDERPVRGSGAAATKQPNEPGDRQHSADVPAAVGYVIQARFAKAMKHVRSSLEAAGLGVVSETDVSARIRTSLGVELAPCSILSVTCPFLLLEAAVMDPAQLTRIPVHVVAIEKDQWTRIYLLNPAGFGLDAASAFTPKLYELSRRIRQCLDQIGARTPSMW